ncbi:unnamed protein product [Arctia plantaginis]|uniref:Uncharacterized protein n=1 Tax=Arctia plantaginis TaxID=874455 RepID=A0A8S1AX84_ARCPL|nr:unnamed protein product [Arctia plantaginis]
MKRTGGGPKPPSPDPETLEIVSMIPQEFETDRNIFDSDGIGMSPKNMTTPITSKINFLHQKKSVMKRKLPFNDDNKPKHLGKEFTKERNHVLLSCIREEHELKMKNIMEIHRFATEEHNLRIQIQNRNQNLLNEESQLRMQKLKLEIALLKSTNNL